MIDLETILKDLPHFETYCSVERLHSLAQTLNVDPRFQVDVLGMSEGGIPIYDVKFGSGRIKALIVTGPHSHEPIGSLAAYGLMHLLQSANPTLMRLDVEWHIVPCIDPDGAILNEGWTQSRFTLASYMRNFHLRSPPDVDASIPIKYKRWNFDSPRPESKILRRLIDTVKPDFYYSQHNSFTGGGAWLCLSRDIGDQQYQRFYDLFDKHQIPLQRTVHTHGQISPAIAPGVLETIKLTRMYDALESSSQTPEKFLEGFGETTYAYVTELKEGALVLISELPPVVHRCDGSYQDTGQSARKLRLRVDADNKHMATLILEEWDRVGGDLDYSSPLYRTVTAKGIGQTRDMLSEQAPRSRPTRDILLNAAYGGTMTESERFNVYMWERYRFLCANYEFVRLLKSSPQTASVRGAIERLDRAFDEALDDLAKQVDMEGFDVIDCDTLAKVQLGIGLIALDTLLRPTSGASDVGHALSAGEQ